MIEFKPITLEHKEEYLRVLSQAPRQGCEYSFANLFLWGRQQVAFLDGNVAVFSQFNRKSVYLFPVGNGDLKATLDRIIEDADRRGIPCRLTGLTEADCAAVERLYPNKFRFHTDRDSFDYVYEINDLADLAGRRFQRKRNHLNRFFQQHPQVCTEPITDENTAEAWEMLESWYSLRLQQEPTADFHMEQAALRKALRYRKELNMEGLLLRVDGGVEALTLGSLLTENTFDIHFEKALERSDGTYAAINQAFARYLRQKYPPIALLNREDDMGLEGLRKAKCSYNPTRMNEKYWACLLEDGYDY